MPKRHHVSDAKPAESASSPFRNRLEETIENEWLGLGDTTLIPTENPFEVRSVEDIENPTRHFLRIARDPRFFSFSCKHFLNREVSPMQACVLWELWHRPFPMLLGGRGFGKCVTHDTLIATSDGFREIGELVKGGAPQEPLTRDGLQVCGEERYKPVAYAWNNGFGPTVKMTTRCHYELEGTHNHPVRVVKDGGLAWKRLDELQVGDRIPIDRNPYDNWHDAKGGLDEDTAYLFGLLVGDGCYTQESFIGFTSADPELVAAVNRISLKVWGKPFRFVQSSKYQHNIYSRSARRSLFEKYGFRHADCENKCFPDSVLRSSQAAVAAFIRGLMDTDGSLGRADVSCTAKSFIIIKQLQFCLARFGIASHRGKYWNKKYQRYYWKVFIGGSNVRRFKERIGFGLTRKQQKLERICGKKVNENLDLIPRQLTSPHFYALRDEFFRRAPAKKGTGRRLSGILSPSKFESYELSYERLGKILEATRSCEDTDAWKRLSEIHRQHHFYDAVETLEQSQNETCDVHVPDDHSFISNGVISHNSTLLAFYIMLRALLCQGSKIVIVGAVFRQSKVVFNYCDAIWRSSPILRSMANPGDGPRHESDRLSLQLGESQIVGLPVGDGTKIRGERASILIADEFSAQKVDIFENVISGFAAVSLSPIEKTKQAARLRAMQRLGVQLGDMDLPIVPGMNSNQTILAGTCYYSFNHSYDYWKHYKAIIESKGDKRALDEIFKGEVPDKFNWKDFSIIRVPANMLPEGYMDERHISKAKATLHRSQYLMEYGACHSGDTKVITDCGVKQIADVVPGDKVLTHLGRFRPVLAVTHRKIDRDVVQWKAWGSNCDNVSTLDHPFWDGKDWTALTDLDYCSLANLVELNGRQHFAVEEAASNFLETKSGRAYPTPSKAKLNREQIADIRASTKTKAELAREYGVKHSTISSIIKNQHEPKNSIPSQIRLDYKFGLVVGYYAAEGSIGANGRAATFSLDGHVGAGLEQYVAELTDACRSVFGFSPKVYAKESVANVTVNQRLVADLLSYICPGVSHTKVIRPEVLYSNPDFLKGVITGYWNGDGHYSRDKPIMVGGCVNESLLSQIRVGLSYFGIASFIGKIKPASKSVFRGKEYHCRQAYCVRMYGNNAKKFQDVIYGSSVDYGNLHRQRFWNNGRESVFPLIKKEATPFNGFVYNLDVKEDHSYSLLNATVHNCWVKDSDGFFKRTLIESCVVGRPDNPIELPSCGPVRFSAALRGDRDRCYVMGVDPASESDNFAIVILEVHPDHRRIVFCWTTTRRRHRARLAKSLAKDENFYTYAARKIRDLAQAFPCVHIAMDKMGGGISVEEALRDSLNLEEGEIPILPVIVEDDEKDTDRMPGDHILELVKFANADYVSGANHGMRKDFEDKLLLFPEFDHASVGIAYEEDRLSGRIQTNEDGQEERLYDTLEDCILDIEELKEELASIVHTQTGTTKRDHWDTPEGRNNLGQKTRSRKDRYSALLMANMAARSIALTPPRAAYHATGGFAQNPDGWITPAAKSRHQNPSWYDESGEGYSVVLRGR